MREIKFRALDKDSGRMYEVAKLDFWGDPDQASCDLAGPDEDGELAELFDIYLGEVELMQYTGLKDKYGVEIYEGDIVEWSTLPEDGELLRQIQVVTYSQGSFLLMNPEGTTPPFDYMSDAVESHQEYRVIGNVYEHPDLLIGEGDWEYLGNKEKQHE